MSTAQDPGCDNPHGPFRSVAPEKIGVEKTYVGRRTARGVEVWVIRRGDHVLLHPNDSQKVHNHSPDGFEWGYRGSGPAQLALGILLDFTGDRQKAIEYYQNFRDEVIANLPRQDWKIHGMEVAAWLA